MLSQDPPNARILLVEDEFLVAMVAEEALIEFGCTVIGPVDRIEVAIELAESEPLDAALLDVNIAGNPVYPVAEVLARRGVPFAFVSGYGASDPGCPEAYRAAPVMPKPYGTADIERILALLLRPAGLAGA